MISFDGYFTRSMRLFLFGWVKRHLPLIPRGEEGLDFFQELGKLAARLVCSG